MTVVVTAIFHPKPGRKDELVRAMGPGIEAVHGEEGCELYAIHDAEDGTVTMIEKWTSREALDAHSAGDPVKRLTEPIAELLETPTQVTVMTPLPAGTARQGVL